MSTPASSSSSTSTSTPTPTPTPTSTSTSSSVLSSAGPSPSVLHHVEGVFPVPVPCNFLSECPSAVGRVYVTHDNYARPFRVWVHEHTVKVFLGELDYMVAQWTTVRQVWLGDIPIFELISAPLLAHQQRLGNSLLMWLDDLDYIFIQSTICHFTALDPIVQFSSPITSNDVPEPFAVDTHGRHYVLEVHQCIIHKFDRPHYLKQIVEADDAADTQLAEEEIALLLNHPGDIAILADYPYTFLYDTYDLGKKRQKVKKSPLDMTECCANLTAQLSSLYIEHVDEVVFDPEGPMLSEQYQDVIEFDNLSRTFQAKLMQLYCSTLKEYDTLALEHEEDAQTYSLACEERDLDTFITTIQEIATPPKTKRSSASRTKNKAKKRKSQPSGDAVVNSPVVTLLQKAALTWKQLVSDSVQLLRQEKERVDQAHQALLTAAQEQKDGAAMKKLGDLYQSSHSGVEQCAETADAWYEQAAQAGDRAAMVLVAKHILKNKQKQIAKAVKWLLTAGQAGSGEAWYELGRLYQNELSAFDMTQSSSYFCAHPIHQHLLAPCKHLLGKLPGQKLISDRVWTNVNELHSVIIRCFSQAAEDGHIPAMIELGRMHDDDHTYPFHEFNQIDHDKSVHWYRQAIQTDGKDSLVVHDALCFLGIKYENGQGVSQSVEEAHKLFERVATSFEKHAKSGGTYDNSQTWTYVLCLHKLGYFYYHGERVPKSVWLDETKQYDPYRLYMMVRLAEAFGRQPWWSAALELLKFAAARGERRALTALGRCYQDGHGVEEDAKQAAEYFTQAVALGDPMAMVLLATAYKYGQGVDQSSERAKELFTQAASTNHPGVKMYLENEKV